MGVCGTDSLLEPLLAVRGTAAEECLTVNMSQTAGSSASCGFVCFLERREEKLDL